MLARRWPKLWAGARSFRCRPAMVTFPFEKCREQPNKQNSNVQMAPPVQVPDPNKQRMLHLRRCGKEFSDVVLR